MICEGTVKLKYPNPGGTIRTFPVFYGWAKPDIHVADSAKAVFVNQVNALRASQGLDPVERVIE